MAASALVAALTLVSFTHADVNPSASLVLIQQRARMTQPKTSKMDQSLLEKAEALDVSKEIKIVNKTADILLAISHNVNETVTDALAIASGATASFQLVLDKAIAMLSIASIAKVVSGDAAKKAMEWAETAAASSDNVVTVVQESVDLTREKLQMEVLKYVLISEAFANSLHKAADTLADSNTDTQTALFKHTPGLFVKNKCDKALAEIANANATLDKGIKLVSFFNTTAFGCLNGITGSVEGALSVVNGTANAGIAAANLLPEQIKEKAIDAIHNLLSTVTELKEKVEPTIKLVEKKMSAQVKALSAIHLSMEDLTARTNKICGDATSQVSATP